MGGGGHEDAYGGDGGGRACGVVEGGHGAQALGRGCGRENLCWWEGGGDQNVGGDPCWDRMQVSFGWEGRAMGTKEEDDVRKL